MNKYKKFIETILTSADIQIDGDKPWDIHIHNENFYNRIITKGEIAFGESYMDFWWDAEKVDELVCKILQSNLEDKLKQNLNGLIRLLILKTFNLQSKKRAFIVGEKHYDLGNDLFQNMLDKRMNYSCAYWKDAKNLDEAQENKLELICRKLSLKPGLRILDIGCGWGAFGKYAAEKYQVEVVGLTVSKEQVLLGKKLTEGLAVEFRLMDYRDLNEKFDRIVSVGMFEHVGVKNYKTFFGVASKNLNDNGLFLLHTIGSNISLKSLNAWTNKYIFPNGMLPSIAQIGKSIEGIFVMEDWHNFGHDYDKTLMAWHKNFSSKWEKIKDQYSERFYRMWTFYLLSSAAAFRARNKQVWQLVLSKKGIANGYLPLR
jgi:cyclopropane-fatty-acyl-phospholipid synthase